MENLKVFIYRNLHFDGHVYSIKSLTGLTRNRVVGHAKGILLQNVEFVVNEKGRQRVLKEKRKNVHAGIVGEIIGLHDYRPRMPSSLSSNDPWNDQIQGFNVNYNPYLYSSFIVVTTNKPIIKAELVSLWNGDIKVLTKPVNIITTKREPENASNSKDWRSRYRIKHS